MIESETKYGPGAIFPGESKGASVLSEKPEADTTVEYYVKVGDWWVAATEGINETASSARIFRCRSHVKSLDFCDARDLAKMVGGKVIEVETRQKMKEIPPLVRA